jgi:hypothetical protein
MKNRLLFLALGSIVGYLVAIMFFSVTTLIDSSSGSIIVRYGVFPFSVEKNTTKTNAFYHSYGRFSEASNHGKLLYVSSDNFLPIKRNETTLGQYLLLAESNLLMADSINNYSLEKRKSVAEDFFEILNKKSVFAAYEFSQNIAYGDSETQ